MLLEQPVTKRIKEIVNNVQEVDKKAEIPNRKQDNVVLKPSNVKYT